MLSPRWVCWDITQYSGFSLIFITFALIKIVILLSSYWKSIRWFKSLAFSIWHNILAQVMLLIVMILSSLSFPALCIGWSPIHVSFKPTSGRGYVLAQSTLPVVAGWSLSAGYTKANGGNPI